MRMPTFIVDDSSYVSVYETTNSFQSSLASSAFSELEVKTAMYVACLRPVYADY